MKKIMGSKAWDIIWITCGWAALLYAVYLSYKGGTPIVWVIITGVGSILAPLIVNLMANQKVKLGTGLGVIGATLDAANYWSLGIMGSVMTAIWALITYLKGFLSFRKQEKFEATKTSKKNLIVCGIVAVIGCVIVIALYCLNPANAPEFMRTNLEGLQGQATWFKICNILLIVSMMISQYLLVEGKSVAWFSWIVTNIFQVITTAYSAFVLGMGPAYFIVSIMFVINTIKGCVLWYQPKSKETTNA